MAKIKHNNVLDTIDEVLTNSKEKGVLHLYSEDEFYTGRTFKIKGKDLLNFGTTSYLGLAQDERLIEGSIQAIRKYGTQFPLSKTYISCVLYQEIEELLYKMYGYSTLITKNSTLAHIGVIPSAVRDQDAVILDHQVHASVQNACQLLKPRGIRVEMVRHSNLEMLERRVQELSNKHEAVWYMIDGVYSMYGDCAPMKELIDLMDKYPKLHLYADDVHGMSWAGKNGTGYVMKALNGKLHDRMILTTTMSKTFGASGGIVVFPNEELFRKVKTFGGPLTFSAQLEPATLGAAIASAKLHLSDEIYEMQQDLEAKIQYFNDLLEKINVPLVQKNNSPVFYLGTGMPVVGHNFVKRMMNTGFFLNLGIFPAVPVKNTGVRITISRHNTMEDIKSLVAAIEVEYPKALADENTTINQVRKAFNLPIDESEKIYLPIVNQYGLKIRRETSITSFNKKEWNEVMKGQEASDWDSLAFLESSFVDNNKEENNWKFYYYYITDEDNIPILATFLTSTLWKEDMLSPSNVSLRIEKAREEDPYYLTSRVISLGSFATTGAHMYLDQTHENWKPAFSILLNEIEKIQTEEKADNILLRDFLNENDELKSFLLEKGFLRINMPDTCIVKDIQPWTTTTNHLNELSSQARRRIRKEVFKHEHLFDFEVKSTVTSEELDHYISLYKNVKNRNFEINMFEYPQRFFEKMVDNPNWEFVTLSFKDEHNQEKTNQPVAVVFSYKGTDSVYIPLLIGMDYEYVSEYKVYKQMLYQLARYAKKEEYREMSLGFSAAFEKKKIGATTIPTGAYIQAKDNYSIEKIEMMASGT